MNRISQTFIGRKWFRTYLVNIITGNPYLEARVVEQKLISSYDIPTIKELLIQWASMNPSKQLWRINSSWELAIPLQSLVVSLPRGALQDLSYILLAKSKELMNLKDFDQSFQMLQVLEDESKTATGLNPNIVHKMSRLISWEGLLVKITQLFSEWPGSDISKYSYYILI